MRILFVTEFFPTGKDLRFSGGVETRTLYVAQRLAAKHKVFVVTSHLNGTKKHEKIGRLEIFRVGPARDYSASVGNFYNRLRFAASAIKCAKTLNPDIIDGSNFLTHLVTIFTAKSLKIPSVAWYPDVWIGSWIKLVGLAGLIGEALERLNLFFGSDAYIAISHETERKLKKYTNRKIKIISCGVNLSEFKITKRVLKSPSIICISRLVAYKRIRDLLFAFAYLIKKGIKVDLQIVGIGPQQEELKNINRMLKITKYVHFYSNLPRRELIKKLKSASVFCLPSEAEGFGIATIEAAAAGVPYVVSDIEVFKEVTKNGQGGFLFKLGDIGDLSSKISRLLTDKNLYRRKREEALNLAQKYEWSQIAEQTEALYKSLLSRK